MKSRFRFTVVVFFVCASAFTQDVVSNNPDVNARYAREEFRIGVQAFNRFAFNEAILSFERALSFLPAEPLILDWLGRAYYRSGLEEAAVRAWRSVVAGLDPFSAEAMLANSRIEIVQSRRNYLPIADDSVRYVESGRYPGHVEQQTLYRQPTAVLPYEDGSVWIVAYGSNELVRIDVNGIVRQRQRGPINGFDRPYDIARGLDGRLYVSEYRGDRVSILNSNGDWQAYIGKKGLEDGQFVGPQNLTVDEDGYLYVVDYGNRRVSKFGPDGDFVLSFGKKIKDLPDFPGFISPTGIAARNGRVYIADAVSKQIYIFDPNGGFLGVLVKAGLVAPESLRFLSDGRLLVTDANRVLLIDVDSAIIRELGSVGNAKVRLTSAEMDRNGGILAANFQASEVSILTRLDDMASGLFVQIERVVSSAFPKVTVEVSVQDKLRRPIVGLDHRNFILSEQGKPVLRQQFLGAGFRAATSDVSILVERSESTRNLTEDIATAVKDISASAGRVVSLVSAGEQPSKEQVSDARQGDSHYGALYSPRWRFDLGLRLSATDLLPAEKKRAVVFIGAGALGELAFENYGLSELAAYLANNGIAFYAVVVGGGKADESLSYLCKETGGAVLPLYRSEGVKPVIGSLVSKPSGVYILSYETQLPTDFGNAYLPVEAEVYLMERSGRDKSGYFPPRQ
ncbi:MAG: NHL repeat-containing protein [Treponema sp.]|nr:NHL repeat-containing protein [Treponema sp.]